MVSKKSNKSIRNRIKNKRGGCLKDGVEVEGGTVGELCQDDAPPNETAVAVAAAADDTASGSGSIDDKAKETADILSRPETVNAVQNMIEQLKDGAPVDAAAESEPPAESPEKAAAKTELDDAQKALNDMGEETPENKEARDAAVAKVDTLTTAYNAMAGGRRRSRRHSGKKSKKSKKNSKKSSARKSKKSGRSRKNGSKRRAHRKH